jgi:hypothetical protein
MLMFSYGPIKPGSAQLIHETLTGRQKSLKKRDQKIVPKKEICFPFHRSL